MNEKEKNVKTETAMILREISINLIDPFPNHPYKVIDDEKLDELTESIKAQGVLTPCLVRPMKEGRYELISGHRRVRACKKLYMETVPCYVRELSKEESIILMVESNFQRAELLPSEKAFAYKMRLDAMKLLVSRMRENQKKGRNFKGEPVEPQIEKAREHLINSYGLSEEYAGKLGDADSRRHDHKDVVVLAHQEKVGPLGPRGRVRDGVAAETGESSRQIHRYIRLTELIPELLQLVDVGLIGMRPAVELSYLGQKQKDIYVVLDREQLTPTHAQTIRMRKLFDEGKLTNEAIEEILLEEKPNQIEHISIRMDRIKDYLPKDLPKARREEHIIEALRFYLAKAKE